VFAGSGSSAAATRGVGPWPRAMLTSSQGVTLKVLDSIKDAVKDAKTPRETSPTRSRTSRREPAPRFPPTTRAAASRCPGVTLSPSARCDSASALTVITPVKTEAALAGTRATPRAQSRKRHHRHTTP